MVFMSLYGWGDRTCQHDRFLLFDQVFKLSPQDRDFDFLMAVACGLQLVQVATCVVASSDAEPHNEGVNHDT